MAPTAYLLSRFAACALLLSACASSSPDATDHGASPKATNPAIAWVQTAAEYDAISRSVYRAAQDALPGKVADVSWSALPDQTDAGDLPAAVILDVDETVVSNAEFQSSFIPPFSDKKLDVWNRAHRAVPITGVVEFAKQARQLGVTLFFLTNRPCTASENDRCPQKTTVVQDIGEAGIPVSGEFVMLSAERPEWGKEKSVRRNYVARNYRVIMLIGDDLGDFIPCTRQNPVHPCTQGATVASRQAATLEYQEYWGNGWYILPNPMHGSWASVK